MPIRRRKYRPINLTSFIIFQLDTWFGRPKKSGRGGGVRSGSGNNTIPRPHSGDDFNEIEQQRCIIERMDKDTMNDRFEEMLVRSYPKEKNAVN